MVYRKASNIKDLWEKRSLSPFASPGSFFYIIRGGGDQGFGVFSVVFGIKQGIKLIIKV